ncbi:PREDICTED: uncharacterized protein LOC104788966 [Camelina sativa]|uniref:Uncharacterized protein LOC104788966 n=1 Tax=Camelina sativa TaxID=90675 RepID=A0ABM0ZB18_CAMSA|nr:PREDICTED: uncharacterized protein LOC104788966 [Camelina sativa]
MKMEKLLELIDPTDIPLITCLQPSRRFMVDDYVWSFTKSGQYSVRSGYAIATSLCQEVVEPSLSKLKSQVWKLKSSRKLKHFLWQAISGFVAANSRLVERHCGSDRSCPRCGDELESINHILFMCPPALQVWAMSTIANPPSVFPSTSLYANFDYLFWGAKDLGVTEEQLEVFPWIIWYNWKARNEKMFNNKDVSPADTGNLAAAEALAWRVAQMVESFKESDEEQSDVSEEEEEPLGAIRCQIDASWDEKDGFAGLGFVLQSAEKIFGLQGINRHLSVLHSELEALIWAMESAILQGLNSVHFETDCVTIIKIIEEIDEWPSFATELDRFSELRAKFFIFSISYIPRTINVCADRLAKAGRARGAIFSHVNLRVPEWLTLETNLFELE